jgi:hypothetical protein
MVLQHGLVGYWNMDDNTNNSNILNELGYSNGDVLHFNSEDINVSGKVGNAKKITTTDEKIEFELANGDFTIVLGNTLSLNLWLKIENSSSTVGIFRYSVLSEIAALYGFILYLYDHKLYLSALTDTGIGYSLGTTIVDDDTWKNITITNNLGSWKVYINGTEELTLEKDGGVSAEYENISMDLKFSSAGVVSFDEMGLWNRVLSSSEMSELYNSGNGTTFSFKKLTSNKIYSNNVSVTNATIVSETTSSQDNFFYLLSNNDGLYYEHSDAGISHKFIDNSGKEVKYKVVGLVSGKYINKIIVDINN